MTTTTVSLTETYNGWSNYETWNVALWLQNDQNLYYLCREIGNYIDTIDAMADAGTIATRDGVAYSDPAVNIAELNELVFDFN